MASEQDKQFIAAAFGVPVDLVEQGHPVREFMKFHEQDMQALGKAMAELAADWSGYDQSSKPDMG